MTKRSEKGSLEVLTLIHTFAVLAKQIEAANEEAVRAEERARMLAERWEETGDLIKGHLGDAPVLAIFGYAHIPSYVVTRSVCHITAHGALPSRSPITVEVPEVLDERDKCPCGGVFE